MYQRRPRRTSSLLSRPWPSHPRIVVMIRWTGLAPWEFAKWLV